MWDNFAGSECTRHRDSQCAAQAVDLSGRVLRILKIAQNLTRSFEQYAARIGRPPGAEVERSGSSEDFRRGVGEQNETRDQLSGAEMEPRRIGELPDGPVGDGVEGVQR